LTKRVKQVGDKANDTGGADGLQWAGKKSDFGGREMRIGLGGVTRKIPAWENDWNSGFVEGKAGPSGTSGGKGLDRKEGV